MRMTAGLSTWVAGALAGFVAVCVQAQDLKTLKDHYEKNVEEIRSGFQPKFEDLQGQYLKTLDALKSRAQNQGDLKTIKAAIAEIERFRKAQNLPATPNQNALKAINSLQSDYVKQFTRQESNMTANLAALTVKYAQSLDGLLRELTKAGKLEDAMAVESEQAKARLAIKGYADKMAALKRPAATIATVGPVSPKWATGPWMSNDKKGLYLVVCLSHGTKMNDAPVTCLADVPKGGWTDEYKTDKLVLRRIDPGTFMMGSPEDELGHVISETLHKVTLTKAFYIGVFEVTQKQWERVMGDWPSAFNSGRYRDARPVEQVSFNDIRGAVDGASWPASNAVDSVSFMGRLRVLTGQAFDLPTEAQWEYACRAGTASALSSGKNLTSVDICPNLSELGRYKGNRRGGVAPNIDPREGGTAIVGLYLPNPWGLYDMHCNVVEWCLDWQGNYPRDVSDPVGEDSGPGHVGRGVGWSGLARLGRSANRQHRTPDFRDNDLGFRVALPQP